MRVDVEVLADAGLLEGVVAISWEWLNADGVCVLAPADAPPLTLVVRLERLDSPAL